MYFFSLFINNEFVVEIFNSIIVLFTLLQLGLNNLKSKFRISANFGKWAGFVFLFIFFIINWINNVDVLFIYKQLTFISIFILSKILIESLLGIENNNKVQAFSEYIYEKRGYNYLYIGLLLIAIGYSVFNIYFKSIFHINYETVALLLFVTFPFFDYRFYFLLNEFLRKVFFEKEIYLKPQSLKKLSKIKTIAFEKYRVITDGNYKMVSFNHRKTIQKTTVLQLFSHIIQMWSNSIYKNVRISDDNLNDFEKLKFLESSRNRVVVSDSMNNEYILTTKNNNSNKLKEEYNLFLYKNDIQVAKFLVIDKPLTYSKKLLSELNNQGFNTVLFCNDEERVCSKTVKGIGFDKIYNNIDYIRKTNLLKQLQEKAPVMYVTDDGDFVSEAELNCSFNSNINKKATDIIFTNPLNLIWLNTFWKKASKKLFGVFIMVLIYHLVFYYLIISHNLSFELILTIPVLIELIVTKLFFSIIKKIGKY
ncbi:MAG: hypothetical protein GXO79_14715 [Chlorobi bacterium]|nr:hypothetical protein [Chlorobiota bacterium]